MTKERLLAAAAAEGCEAGVCPFSAVSSHLLPCRAASRLPENAATVLVLLFPYRIHPRPPVNFSRYAAVNDYHHAAGEVLQRVTDALRRQDPDGQYQPFIDNSPLPEVAAAVGAGLGVRGDNGLFYSRTYGSFVFIGCIVTDREVGAVAATDAGCFHCGACGKVCPTGRLTDGGECLSAITQKKGELTERETAYLRRGGSAWGCDLCQEICPLNKTAVIDPHPCFTSYENELTDASLTDLTGKAYGWRGGGVPARNLRLLKKSE
ncbi:MAG: epoxyqueuosine reductase [Clostridia bacterium]|nr:epoxyqueuosine reductase [Clostridia bacterium]